MVYPGLYIRGLPKLVTTTSSSTTTTSSFTSYIPSTVTGTNSTVTTSYSNGTVNTMTYSNYTYSSYIPAGAAATSTRITTGSVVIPNKDNVPYLYKSIRDNGTVYIATGSCFGFIMLVIFLVWLFLMFKSWRDARRSNKLNDIERKYNMISLNGNGNKLQPPTTGIFNADEKTFFNSDFDSNSSNSESDSDESDISEKILRQMNSTTDILNSGTNPNPNPNSHNYASSVYSQMFISPTEYFSHNNNVNINNGSSYNSNSSSTNNNSMHSLFDSPTVPQVIITNVNNSDNNNNTTNKKKTFRPPSVHLDRLLDNDE